MKPQALVYLRRLMRPWGDKHGVLARGRSWLSSLAALRLMCTCCVQSYPCFTKDAERLGKAQRTAKVGQGLEKACNGERDLESTICLAYQKED